MARPFTAAISKWPANYQAAVEAAIGKVANHDISVICAGRTDAGFSRQIIHFDTSIGMIVAGFANLPDTIAMR